MRCDEIIPQFAATAALVWMAGAALGCAGIRAAPWSPGVLFESAIGPTPSHTSTAAVDGNRWVGHRFEIEHRSHITGVGAYFGGGVQGFYPAPSVELFAAIIALSDGEDLPDSQELSTADCVATQVFRTLPVPGDAIAPMDVTVEPGWYLVLVGSNAFGAQFEGLQPAELPIGFEDDSPGQLMLAIIHGQTDFFLNEGAPRFVVHGDRVSEIAAARDRPATGCSSSGMTAAPRPLRRATTDMAEYGVPFAVRRDEGVACNLSPNEVWARVGLWPIVEMRCTTAGALPVPPQHWVEDLVVWEVEVLRSGTFIFADKTGSLIGERREGTGTISGTFDPAIVVIREPGTQCRMTPAEVYAFHPDPELRELRCTSHDRLVQFLDSDGNILSREPVWKMIWDDYYLLIHEGRREVFGGNLEMYPPRRSSPEPAHRQDRRAVTVEVDEGVSCSRSPDEIVAAVGELEIVSLHCTTADRLGYATSESGRDVVWVVQMERGSRVVEDRTGMMIGAGGEGLVMRGGRAPVPEPAPDRSGNFDPTAIATSDPGARCKLTPEEAYALRPSRSLLELRCSTWDRGQGPEPVWILIWDDHRMIFSDETRSYIGGGGRGGPYKNRGVDVDRLRRGR